MATRLPDVFRTASPDQGHGQASSAFRTLDRLLLEQSRHGDPFSVLGLHEDPDGSLRIRACLPGARRVCAVWTLARRRPSQDAQAGDAPKEQRLPLARLRSDWLEAETGRVEWSPLFEAEVPRRRTRFRYHLEVEWDSGLRERLDDPYQWGTWLPSLGLQAFARGLHWRPHRLLGAHPVSWAGVAGVSFAVWAPEAQAVSVVGDFNLWDARRHPMRRRVEAGVWELFIPGVPAGACYKYELLDAQGERRLKADPLARQGELRPRTASRVPEAAPAGEGHWPWQAPMAGPLPLAWREPSWQEPSQAPSQALSLTAGVDGSAAAEPAGQDAPRKRRAAEPALPAPDPLGESDESLRALAHSRAQPIAVYELHAGSWRRGADGGFLDWRALSAELPAYVAGLGFTHVELLPVMEHPFDGSWGYQCLGLFAPSARQGDLAGLRTFVAACHAHGLKVLLDWVPAHFPKDEHGLVRFDGSALWEYADPREGEHPDWQTLIYDWRKPQVCSLLVASALFWLEEVGVDGLRVDAVASMLHRNYSRADGQWLPNEHGGSENLEAIAFLRLLNHRVQAAVPGALLFAEESSAFPGVTRAVRDGGLGFGSKWNMGWMNDTLAYVREDPVHRSWHHDKVTFGLVYAFDEHHTLPISHDEVVHGKGSLRRKMPGDAWQQWAGLRAYLAFMWLHPGKKLLFMGQEFGQWSEWNHDLGLPWDEAQSPEAQACMGLVRWLNGLYRGEAALQQDADREGFRWAVIDDRQQSVFGWWRLGRGEAVLVMANFTPVPREGYRVGVPDAWCEGQPDGALSADWTLLLDTDEALWGGSSYARAMPGPSLAGAGQPAVPAHGQARSVSLCLPPLAVVAWKLPVALGERAGRWVQDKGRAS